MGEKQLLLVQLDALRDERDGLKARVRALEAEVDQLRRLPRASAMGKLGAGRPLEPWQEEAVARLRAWMQEETRPLRAEEGRDYVRWQGLTAAKATESYNAWAKSRGYEPRTRGWLECWLLDPELRLASYRYEDVKSTRYGIELRTASTRDDVS